MGHGRIPELSGTHGLLSWLELIAWIPELPGTCCLDSRALANLCQGLLAIFRLSWSCLVALLGAFPEPSGVARELWKDFNYRRQIYTKKQREHN